MALLLGAAIAHTAFCILEPRDPRRIPPQREFAPQNTVLAGEGQPPGQLQALETGKCILLASSLHPKCFWLFPCSFGFILKWCSNPQGKNNKQEGGGKAGGANHFCSERTVPKQTWLWTQSQDPFYCSSSVYFCPAGTCRYPGWIPQTVLERKWRNFYTSLKQNSLNQHEVYLGT